MDEEKILRDAIAKWGKEHQLKLVKEELAELIVAISHWERGRADIGKVVTEMVDVTIMLGQVAIIIADDGNEGTSEYVDKLYSMEMDEKFKRLEKRIKEK